MVKKVIVFGATGLMGKQIVKENIKAGNEVTVYIRQTEYSEPVNIITGELNDDRKIVKAIKDFDIIVSAVGNRNYEDPTKVVSPLTRLLSKSVTDHQRLIVVFGAGLMLVAKNMMLKETGKDNDTLKNQRADHWEAFTNLLPLDINYLMICPTWVIEGDADENYLIGDTYFPKSDKIQVLAGNVGHFIAKEINENKFNKTRIGLVNK